ncbi:hypothetical protein IP88_00025 [alpha proteobacterium AAP81b]|nr:hypothetical protein IP88_00025 [alpha proteobacterium AAP81b]
MIAQTRIAANGVAEKLLAAEAAIDAALAAVAGLTASVPLATQAANVGMHVGQEALMHAMESCQQLVKARTNIIRTHKALRSASGEVGLGNVMFADTHCPPEAAAGAPARHLAVVAA